MWHQQGATAGTCSNIVYRITICTGSVPSSTLTAPYMTRPDLQQHRVSHHPLHRLNEQRAEGRPAQLCLVQLLLRAYKVEEPAPPRAGIGQPQAKQ